MSSPLYEDVQLRFLRPGDRVLIGRRLCEVQGFRHGVIGNVRGLQMQVRPCTRIDRSLDRLPIDRLPAGYVRKTLARSDVSIELGAMSLWRKYQRLVWEFVELESGRLEIRSGDCVLCWYERVEHNHWRFQLMLGDQPGEIEYAISETDAWAAAFAQLCPPSPCPIL